MRVIKNNFSKATRYQSSSLLVTAVVLLACGQAEELQAEPQRDSNKKKRHVSLSQP